VRAARRPGSAAARLASARAAIPTRSTVPSPTSQGSSAPAPVVARVAAFAPVPVFPLVPLTDAPVDVAPTAAVVVVVVAPEGEVVVVLVLLVVVVAAAAAVNVTVTERAERGRLSVVSVAVYLTDSTVASLTAKVAIPLLLVVALVAATLELPLDPAKVTAFPLTGSPLPS